MAPPVGASVPPLPGALPDEPCLSPPPREPISERGAIYEFVKRTAEKTDLRCAALPSSLDGSSSRLGGRSWVSQFSWRGLDSCRPPPDALAGLDCGGAEPDAVLRRTRLPGLTVEGLNLLPASVMLALLGPNRAVPVADWALWMALTWVPRVLFSCVSMQS